MRYFFVIPVFFFILGANGQSSDTARHNVPASWKKFLIAPRVVVGIQKSFLTQVGFALQRYIYAERYGYIVYNIYSSFEWVPSTKGEKPLYGALAGYEIVNNGGAGAIEVKYLANNETNDVIITPKIGFGIGFINIFYGYNISTNKYPFLRIGKSQFTLVINTNLLFYASKYEK